jgi:F-type H+-transporting ATPase subunit alpha
MKGMILDLSYEYLGILVLGDFSKLQQGQTAKRTGKVLQVGVGKEYLGRVLDGLGKPVD